MARLYKLLHTILDFIFKFPITFRGLFYKLVYERIPDKKRNQTSGHRQKKKELCYFHNRAFEFESQIG
jgi:hypothetical protein